MYELASLRTPFDAQNACALAVKINAGKYARIPSKYSENLHDAIKGMLMLEPKKRSKLEDLEQLPSIQSSLAFAKKQEMEHEVLYSMNKRDQALRVREETVSKRERAATEKERYLADKEKYLSEKERSLSEKERSLGGGSEIGSGVYASGGTRYLYQDPSSSGISKVPSTMDPNPNPSITGNSNVNNIMNAIPSDGGGGGGASSSAFSKVPLPQKCFQIHHDDQSSLKPQQPSLSHVPSHNNNNNYNTNVNMSDKENVAINLKRDQSGTGGDFQVDSPMKKNRIQQQQQQQYQSNYLATGNGVINNNNNNNNNTTTVGYNSNPLSVFSGLGARLASAAAVNINNHNANINMMPMGGHSNITPSNGNGNGSNMFTNAGHHHHQAQPTHGLLHGNIGGGTNNGIGVGGGANKVAIPVHRVAGMGMGAPPHGANNALVGGGRGGGGGDGGARIPLHDVIINGGINSNNNNNNNQNNQNRFMGRF